MIQPEHMGRMDLIREVERLREAINDALADLTPGIAPYSVLADVLDRKTVSRPSTHTQGTPYPGR